MNSFFEDAFGRLYWGEVFSFFKVVPGCYV